MEDTLEAPVQQPPDKLQDFYNSLKANENIKGLPDNYNSFKSAMQDPNKAKAFHDALLGNENIKGLPTDYNQFATGLGLKKVGGAGSPLTSQQSPVGLNPFQSSQPNIEASPITDRALKQKYLHQDDQIRQQRQAHVDHSNALLKDYMGKLSPEEQKHVLDINATANAIPPNKLSVPTKQEQDDYAYSQTPVGKLVNGATYLGQKATKGGLQVLKGAAYLANMTQGTPLTQLSTDAAFDKADNATDFLSKGDQQRVENSKAMSNLGGLAEFLPSAIAGESTGGASFYLQGMGQGKEVMDNAEKNGAKINPTVKNAFILGMGGVNGLLMGDLGKGIFKPLANGLKDDVVANITTNAIKDAAGKDITTQGFKSLLEQGAKDWTDKALQGGTNFLKNTKKAVTDLFALNVGNFALKQGVDATTDRPVFNENLGDLAKQEGETLKVAPLFGAIGSLGDFSKLTPFSSYKNAVVDGLMKDSSDENIARTKDFIQQHGEQQGWTPDQIKATNDHVDEIAKITKSLPKNLPNSKVEKAVDLVMGRNEMQKSLTEEQAKRGELDPSINDIPSAHEQLLTDKIDQANDKLRDIATGKRTTYSKERDDKGQETGKLLKTTDGKSEEISPSRYDLENLERGNNDSKPTTGEVLPNGGKPEPNAGISPADETTSKEEDWAKIPHVRYTLNYNRKILDNPSGYEKWQVEQAKETIKDPKSFFKGVMQYHENNLKENPSSESSKNEIGKLKPLVKQLEEIDKKYETTNNSLNKTENESNHNEKGNAEEGNPEKSGQEETQLPAEKEVVNSGTDKTVPETTFKDKIANLFTKLKGTSNQTKEVISNVSPEEATTVKEKTGLDIEGYKHVIDNFGINHVIGNHGENTGEELRGQIPVTQTDFEKIPDIIKNYDEVENAGKNKMGRDVIRYKKTFDDGTTYYLEELRTGKQELALNTMFKTKEGRRIYDAPEDVSPYSPTSDNASPDTKINNSDNNQENNTGIRNEDVTDERGKDVDRTHKTREQIESEGKRLVESGDLNPDDLAKSIIDKPKPVTAEEQAALRYYKVKLKKEQRAILKDENPENTTENQFKYAHNEDLLETNRKATEIIGNEAARTVGDRVGQMDDDFSRVNVLQRAKMANNGEEISPADKKALEERSKRIEELENKLADREEAIRKLQDKSVVDRVKRQADLEERQAKREVTKASLRKEREGLLADLHLIARKSMGDAGANKIPVEMIVPLAKLARNYVLDGAVTISQVADKILTDLKDHLPNVGKQDIEDVIKENFDKYLHEQNQVRLDRSKKLQGKKLETLKEQNQTGNFEKTVQRKIAVDNDYLNIRAEINRQQTLINKKINDIQNSNKSLGRRAVDFAVKYGRQAKLASVTVLGKLAATGLTTMGLKTVTEGVGAAYSKVLPKIAKKSTIEGGINTKALAQSYAKAATMGMKDAYDELNIKKGGQSNLSALYGKYLATKLPAEAADFFGHLHSAIKAPIKRQAWEYSYAKRVAKGIEQGIDVQGPVVDATNRLNAYKDAERAIFMGDNKISSIYEGAMKTLENSSSTTAQNIGALTRILLPFVKVPTNIVLSTGRYAFGLVPGLSKLGQVGAATALKKLGAESMAKVIHSGMGELTPEESDMVLRNLKHGTVGGAALLLGYFNPKNVGGFYQPGEKRKESEVKEGALKLFGHKIPAFLTEHPIFQAMQIGATFRRFLDAHRHQEGSVTAASLATAAGLAKGIPLANEANNLLDILNAKDDHKLNTFIAKTIKGEIEPSAINQLAEIMDTKNKSAITLDPDNMVKRAADKKHGVVKETKQELESGIPILRKTVPRKH